MQATDSACTEKGKRKSHRAHWDRGGMTHLLGRGGANSLPGVCLAHVRPLWLPPPVRVLARRGGCRYGGGAGGAGSGGGAAGAGGGDRRVHDTRGGRAVPMGGAQRKRGDHTSLSGAYVKLGSSYEIF